MQPIYAGVVIARSAQELDQSFDYIVPQGLELGVGSRVVVPFGRGDRPTEAYVVSVSSVTSYSKAGHKSIQAVIDAEPAFNEELLNLAYWMRSKYAATLYSCIRCIIPAGLYFRADSLVSLQEQPGPARLTKAQKSILARLVECGGRCLLSELENEFPRAGATVKALEASGMVCESDASKARNLSLFISYAHAAVDSPEYEAFTQMMACAPKRISRAAKSVVEFLAQNGPTPMSDLREVLHISASPINTLAAKGVIKIERTKVFRNTAMLRGEAAPQPTLTPDQERVVAGILCGRRPDRPTLIHGVTGSGKTEIYLRLIERVLEEGRQALMLVPEISLTPQTVMAFIRRFGERVSVTHSRLSLGERYDQWQKARDGRISIMIGPRSAVFAPFKRLGLIIIDEEHEKTYKSETSPKFATWEVAQKRAELCGGFVVLGSATPQIETYYAAKQGFIGLYTLPRRINLNPPQINIIDMRLELAKGNTSVFGSELEKALKIAIEAGHQAILFLNRRGFATFVSCRACGFVLSCGNCSINYTYHTKDEPQGGLLMCHYCGVKQNLPENCPQCGSRYIKRFGIGTQKLEAETQKLFPNAAILRMDADTTTGKHSHEEILESFRRREAQILVGTQMIAKGLDFPSVTLVGVVAADLSLNSADFRCAETTFQLLTQVSGRAGRAEHKGKVFIQTYSPAHYAIRCAKDGDYMAFYEQELAFRQHMRYPPFTNLFTIMATSENEKLLVAVLMKLRAIMDEASYEDKPDVLGPTPADVSKIKRRFRWRIIAKHEDEERLKSFVTDAVRILKSREDISGLSLSINPNPFRL